MKFEEFKNIFKLYLEENDINIKEINFENFYTYMKEILKWNEKINLTAIKDEKEFIVKHFIDSLTIEKYIKNGDSIIDIGTGAGFPGVPLKFVKEKSKVTVIDSVNKKLNVIRDISSNLKLENLEVIHTRAEDLAIKPEYREKYDIAVTRAVSGISTILEYMLPFVKIGGRAICMKGPNFKEELDKSQKAIEILGGKLDLIETKFVSGENERNIIIVEKIKKTPKAYPRGKNKPLKEPLN